MSELSRIIGVISVTSGVFVESGISTFKCIFAGPKRLNPC